MSFKTFALAHIDFELSEMSYSSSPIGKGSILNIWRSNLYNYN
nr:MAG TPA: hypothetical protein [Crassvirales sp.]